MIELRIRRPTIEPRRVVMAAAALPIALHLAARLTTLIDGHPPYDTTGAPIAADFTNRITAARLLLAGQAARLYDLDLQRRQLLAFLPRTAPSKFEPFVAPPFDALLYVPLARLPYVVAAVLWFFLSVGLLLLALRWLWPLAPGLHRFGFGRFVLLAGLSMPLFADLYTGQDTALSLLILVGGLRLLDARRDLPAGAVLALGLFKPQVCLLVPLLLLTRRRWRALGAWCGVALALVALSMAVLGPDAVPSYLSLLTSDQLGRMIASLNWQTNTLPGLARSALPGFASPLWELLDLAVLLAYLRAIRRLDLRRGFGLTVAVTVLLTPYLFLYDLSVLLVPAALLLGANRPIRRTVLVVGAIYALLSVSVLRHVIFGGLAWPWSLLDAPWPAVAIAALAFELGRSAGNSRANSDPSQPPPLGQIGLPEGVIDQFPIVLETGQCQKRDGFRMARSNEERTRPIQ